MAPPEDDHLGKNGGNLDEQPAASKGELGPVRDAENGPGTAMQTVDSPGGPLVPFSNRPKILTTPPAISDILNSLRRQWRLALLLGVLLAIPAGLGTWFLVPVTYTAHSFMQSRKSTIIFEDVQNAEESGWEAQETLIRGYRVLNTALNDGLMELEYIKEAQEDDIDPIDYLASVLMIEVPDSEKERKGVGGQILKISMRGDDPDQLRQILEAVTDAYLEEVVTEERGAWLKQKDVMQAQHTLKTDRLKLKREDLQELAKTIGTSDPDTANATQHLLLDQILYLRRQVSEIREQSVQKRREMRAFERQVGALAVAGSILPEDIEAELAQNEDLAQYQTRIAEIQAELDAYQQIYRDSSAEPIKTRQAEISRLQEEQAGFAQQLRNEILAAVLRGERKSEVQLNYERLEAESIEADDYLEELQTEYSELTLRVQEIGEYSADLVRRQDELVHLTQVTNELGYELQKLDLELRANQPRVRRVDGAVRRPKTADTSKRDQLTLMTSFGALLLGIATPTLLDVVKRKVSSANQMSEGLGIRVLGNLPLFDKPKRRLGFRAPTPEAIEELQVAMEESIDGLRAMLLHLPAAKNVRTLMVTSALANEGKTTVASSLATSMGRSGRRTLLIDGDLRGPSAHRFLEMPLEEGLAEVLRGDVAIESVIRPSRMPGLRFLSAGHFDSTSLQALTKKNLGEIFEKLQDEFDFIVVDSAPVLSVVDTSLIGQQCDAAILSVLRDKSRVATIYETIDRLRATQIPVLGCVFNGQHANIFSPGYYTYGYASPQTGQPDTESPS